MVSSRPLYSALVEPRTFQMLGVMNVLDAHQPDQIGGRDEMIEGTADQPLHALDRRQPAQILILLAGAQIGIDPFQHSEVERVLGAEVVIDQVLVDAALLGDAVDASAAQAMGHEFDPRRAQYLGAAGFRIADNLRGS